MKQTKTKETIEKKDVGAMPKDIVKQPTQAVAEYDWSQEGATGLEATRPEDFGIPFLSLLQKGSPEVDEDHPEHATKKIEGARTGVVINTLTRRIVYNKDDNNPLIFIPCFHEKLFQEWKKREAGGGFVQSHRSPVILTKCQRNDKNQDELENGNLIITTSYFYGFYPDEEEGVYTRAILPMSSTQLKKARSWLNLITSIKLGGKTPPMFSHEYHLTTVPESNEKGNWSGWKIVLGRTLGQDDKELIDDCRNVTKSCLETKQLPPAEKDETPF